MFQKLEPDLFVTMIVITRKLHVLLHYQEMERMNTFKSYKNFENKS